MVNLNTQKINSTISFSFKARSFYEKAFEYSLTNNKLDNHNPIYFHVYNPKEYRYYKSNNMY
jgi:hypothetical protein